jgi:hypothetical protein
MAPKTSRVSAPRCGGETACYDAAARFSAAAFLICQL